MDRMNDVKAIALSDSEFSLQIRSSTYTDVNSKHF